MFDGLRTRRGASSRCVFAHRSRTVAQTCAHHRTHPRDTRHRLCQPTGNPHEHWLARSRTVMRERCIIMAAPCVGNVGQRRAGRCRNACAIHDATRSRNDCAHAMTTATCVDPTVARARRKSDASTQRFLTSTRFRMCIATSLNCDGPQSTSTNDDGSRARQFDGIASRLNANPRMRAWPSSIQTDPQRCPSDRCDGRR